MEANPKTTWGIKLNLLQHCKLLFDSVFKYKQEIWEVQTEIHQSERPNCTTTSNLFLTPFSTSVRLCWCCESYKGNYQTPDAHIFHRAASCPLCFWSHLSVISLPLALCLWCAWVWRRDAPLLIAFNWCGPSASINNCTRICVFACVVISSCRRLRHRPLLPRWSPHRFQFTPRQAKRGSGDLRRRSGIAGLVQK